VVRISLSKPTGGSGTVLSDRIAPLFGNEANDDPMALIATIYANMLEPAVKLQGA
jgi:hypothetical protein